MFSYGLCPAEGLNLGLEKLGLSKKKRSCHSDLKSSETEFGPDSAQI